MTETDPHSAAGAEELLAEREWLQRLARRLVGFGPDADDLSQETLRIALEKQPHVGGASGLRRWLGNAARKLAGAHFRKRAGERERERSIARSEELPSAESAVARAEVQRTLAAAVMDLPPSLRAAIALRYFEGLGYEQVAMQLGVSPAASRKRVSRGIAALELALGEELGGASSWMTALAPLAGIPARGLESKELAAGSGMLAMNKSIQGVLLGAGALLAAIAVYGVSQAHGERVGRNVSSTGEDDVMLVQHPEENNAVADGVRILDGQRSSIGDVAEETEERTTPPLLTPGQITVRVTDSRGLPVATAHVSLEVDWASGFDFLGPDAMTERGELITAEPTSEPGVFSAAVFNEHEYRVVVEATGYAAQRRAPCWPNTTVEVTLEEPATFRGVVRERGSNLGVAGALVRVFHGVEETMVDTTTDKNGGFLIEGLGGGPGHWFVVPREHVQTQYTTVELQSGKTTEVVATVEPGHTIRGLVTSAMTGAPIPGTEVSPWGFHGDVRRADPRGLYEIRGRKEGRETLSVRAPGHARMDVPVVIPSEEVDVELPAERFAALDIEDQTGAAVPGAFVEVVRGAGGGALLRSDSSGRVLIGQLTRDIEMSVVIRAPGYGRRSAHFAPGSFVPSLERDEPAHLGRLRLFPAARIGGVLQWPDGDPVADARLYLRRTVDERGQSIGPPLRGPSCICGANGAFSVRELAPGTWSVSIGMPGGSWYNRSVELGSGEILDDLVWTLEADGALRGRVTLANGNPVHHAFVLLENSNTHIEGVRTESDGSFRFDHIANQNYALRVYVDDGTVARNAFDEPILGTTIDNTVADGRFLDVVLAAADRSVRGRVVDESGDGIPLAVVARELTNGKTEGDVLCDENGAFTISIASSRKTVLAAWRTGPLDRQGDLTARNHRLGRSVQGTGPIARCAVPPGQLSAGQVVEGHIAQIVILR